jgi:hypothetical protein
VDVPFVMVDTKTSGAEIGMASWFLVKICAYQNKKKKKKIILPILSKIRKMMVWYRHPIRQEDSHKAREEKHGRLT